MSEPGTSTFGRYRVRERLGAGAMGEVFVAHDDRLGRDIAIKSIRVHGLSALQREVFERRFQHEARALASVSHPHIVPVYDMGIEGEVPYLVMEHLAGKSLAARVEARALLSAEEARRLGAQMASALAAAHAREILHRDVKPGNIIEAEPGVWKLADFGIAHVPDSSLTLTGQFLGSPAYAAPEALGDGEMGPLSDVYALGATLYELLSGELPFGPRGLLSPGALTGERPATPLGQYRPDVPPSLRQVIDRCLARRPEARPNAAELAALLERPVTEAGPVLAPSRWRLPALVVGGVLLLAVLIGVAASGGDDDGPSRRTINAADPAAGSEYERSPKADERWRKANDKLQEGDLRDAEKELGKLLREDPYDREAAALRDQLRSRLDEEPGRGRGRKKHRDRD
ncbi:MAG TPA: protein kinase [Kofleriaceae bacterium]|nr:protein kinase [Kofleriaceae bacterium]